jgi:adenylyl-sulfate kinase
MKGFTLWLTGLPCSGKSTLAKEIEGIFLERGMNVEVLDGDEVRQNLTKDLGFSREDRENNIRRIGYVSKLLSRNGVVTIVAAIAPFQSIRDEVRESIGRRYVEVYLEAPVEELIKRDVKGMYKKALAGEIKNFTGIDDPYEPPEKPEVHVKTAEETVEESTNKIVYTLELLGIIPSTGANNYTEEEEDAIKTRLQDLGYI